MDIKLPSQSASTPAAAARVGDLLTRLGAAGTVEAEVVGSLAGRLLLKSRLGDIQTSNTLNFRPGDRLLLRLDTSGREAVLKASPAPRKPILLDRVEIPQLVRLLPAGKPLLASVQRVVARQAEIRVAGQLLRLPPAVDARRGELLSLRRNDSQRQVEVTRLERKTIYKALLKLLVPRDRAGGRESLVRLVELINTGAQQTARGAAPAAQSAAPSPAARQPMNPDRSRPATERHGALRPAQNDAGTRPSPPPVPAPAAGSASAANAAPRNRAAQLLAASTGDSTGTPRSAAADSGSKTALPPAARGPHGIAADGSRRPPPASAPPQGRAQPGPHPRSLATRAAATERAQAAVANPPGTRSQAPVTEASSAPAARPATTNREPATAVTRQRHANSAHAASRGTAGTPDPAPRGERIPAIPAALQRVSENMATPQPLARGERSAVDTDPTQRAPQRAAEPGPVARASRSAAPAAGAAGTAAAGDPASDARPAARGAPGVIAAMEPIRFLARLAAELPQLDAARVKSWFEAAGLVANPASRTADAPARDIPVLLKRLLEPEGLQRELIAAVRSRAAAETEAGAPRPGASDALAQLQRDGIRLAEQSLVQNLLQRASLGLQQETQQPLTVNLALPLIDDNQVKPLCIDLAQRNRAEPDDANSCWEIRISFEFAGLGPIASHIMLEGRAVAASFYSELADTRAAIENALPELRRQLLDAGFTPGEFHSFAGQLKPAPATAADDFGEALIDVEV